MITKSAQRSVRRAYVPRGKISWRQGDGGVQSPAVLCRHVARNQVSASACRCAESIPGARVCSVVRRRCKGRRSCLPCPWCPSSLAFQMQAGSNALTSLSPLSLLIDARRAVKRSPLQEDQEPTLWSTGSSPNRVLLSRRQNFFPSHRSTASASILTHRKSIIDAS